MAISTSFWTVFWIFRFASLLKTLRGKMTKIFLYLCVLCVVQMFSHMLFFLKSTYCGFCTNQLMPTSFLLTRQGHFLLLTETDNSSCSSIGNCIGKKTEERPAHLHPRWTFCIAIPIKILQFSSHRRGHRGNTFL